MDFNNCFNNLCEFEGVNPISNTWLRHFSWEVAVGAKGVLMVTGTVWTVAASMWNAAPSVWADTDTVWAVVDSVRTE